MDYEEIILFLQSLLNLFYFIYFVNTPQQEKQYEDESIIKFYGENKGLLSPFSFRDYNTSDISSENTRWTRYEDSHERVTFFPSISPLTVIFFVILNGDICLKEDDEDKYK